MKTVILAVFLSLVACAPDATPAVGTSTTTGSTTGTSSSSSSSSSSSGGPTTSETCAMGTIAFPAVTTAELEANYKSSGVSAVAGTFALSLVTMGIAPAAITVSSQDSSVNVSPSFVDKLEIVLDAPDQPSLSLVNDDPQGFTTFTSGDLLPYFDLDAGSTYNGSFIAMVGTQAQPAVTITLNLCLVITGTQQ